MRLEIADIVPHIYQFTGPMMSLAYLPQIYRVYVDRQGAKAISIVTWFGWTCSLSITSLYTWFVAHDSLIFLSSILSLLGCFLVFLLALVRRLQHKRKTTFHLNPEPPITFE